MRHIGLAVSQSGYHKHAAYLIENADLPGFTTREQRVMSMLILAQKDDLRKINGALTDPDFANAVPALRLAVMFMHSRIILVSYWMQEKRECWDEVGVDFSIKTSA